MSTDGSSDELESWARWFRDQLLGVTTVSGGETSTSFSGVDPDRLEEVKGSRRLTLFGPRGSDRSAVGRKIRELAAPGGIWIAVDGASSGAEAVIAAFAAALRDPAQQQEALPRPALFVDDAQELGSEALDLLRELPSEALDLYLGAESGSLEPIGEVVEIIPLSERRSDIPTIFRRLTARYKNPPQLDADAIEVLRSAPWTGDLEELRFVVNRVAVQNRGRLVTASDVAPLVGRAGGTAPPDRSLADLEKEHIYRVLDHFAWNRTRSARSLGIDVKTLYNKLKRYEASAANGS